MSLELARRHIGIVLRLPWTVTVCVFPPNVPQLADVIFGPGTEGQRCAQRLWLNPPAS